MPPAPPTEPPRRILETALYAADLAAAERFYAGLLGLEVQQRVAGRHVFFRCGAAMLLVFDPAATREVSGREPRVPVHGATGAGHVCFVAEAPEIETRRRQFEAAGVAIDADLRWKNGARSLYVRDPGGNSVEFAESRLWS